MIFFYIGSAISLFILLKFVFGYIKTQQKHQKATCFAYLIKEINQRTGEVIRLAIYSEETPSVLNIDGDIHDYEMTVVDKASGQTYGEAHEKLMKKYKDLTFIPYRGH